MSDVVSLRSLSTGVQRERRSIDVIVIIFIVYYWLLQLLRGDVVSIIPVESSYALYVGPAVIFFTIGIFYTLISTKIPKISAIIYCLLGLVIVLSIARQDYRSILTITLLFGTIGMIFHIQPRVSLNLINALFCAAAITTTLLFFLGFSIYTFVPGLNASPEMWWRVSPYPSVAAGALFALFVFIANVALTQQRFRKSMIVITLYFIMFTGIRTALIGFAIAVIYIILHRRNFLNNIIAQSIFFISIFILFIFLIYGSDLLLMLPFADTGFVRTLILRDDTVSGFDFGNQVGTAAIRQWIFDQHIAAFWESPLIGIGTFDLASLNTGYGALDDNVTGSEAFVTGMLARIGLLSIPFFIAVLIMRQPVKGSAQELSSAIRVALLIAMTTYGSFVAPYDFVFFLAIVAIAGGIWTRPVGNLYDAGSPSSAIVVRAARV